MAFGMPALIDAVLFMVRMWLCWICVQSLESALGLWKRGEKLEISMLGGIVLGVVGLPLWAVVGALM